MNDIFTLRQSIYNLQKFQELSTSIKNTVKFGMERGQQLQRHTVIELNPH